MLNSLQETVLDATCDMLMDARNGELYGVWITDDGPVKFRPPLKPMQPHNAVLYLCPEYHANSELTIKWSFAHGKLSTDAQMKVVRTIHAALGLYEEKPT